CMSIPKILVIDDQLALRKAMQKALKNDNYDIVYAENGREGLDQLQKEEPDLIFLDLRMPVMDGFGFLEHIRIKPEDPYLVVVITGHGDDKEVKQCFELGVNFFLRKPLSMTEVRCLANRCLEMKANEKELRLHRDSLESLVAERTLALESQVQFQQVLIDSIPVPVFFKDINLKYSGCNAAFEQSIGLDKKDIIGMTVFDILPRKLAQIHHQKDQLSLQTDTVQVYEMSSVYADGEEHDMLVFKALFNNLDGSVGGLIGTNLDITERKQAELQLEQRSHELENTNTALRVLLKQVKESKEEMEGKVLENLKNLVFPYLETLQENLAKTPQAEYIEVIQNNIKKITSSFTINLTSNFLGLSPREIQVADLVRQGRTNKESANIMNISKNAVEFHRNNLRKKLGIQNQKINLRTYLYSMH
ncbi:MAG: response regulator, partial [Proteobacteria bacterium]|nr:response regulator [Pseudomonadota bacterium]